VSALRKRVGEMREPPLGLEVVPHAGLEMFFDEILGAPTTLELVTGVYRKALPALRNALQRHMEQTNPLADHPSLRVCRFALLEVEDMLKFGEQTLSALVSDAEFQKMSDWSSLLNQSLASAGTLDGTEPATNLPAQRVHSATLYRYDPVPKRDERFPDPYN